MSEEGGSLDASGVHDRAHIVHALLDGRIAANAVRQSSAPLVEDDDARERPEPLEARSHPRVLPVHLNVRDPPWDIHEVERAIAKYLIGDVHVAAVGVAGLWNHPVLL